MSERKAKPNKPREENLERNAKSKGKERNVERERKLKRKFEARVVES